MVSQARRMTVEKIPFEWMHIYRAWSAWSTYKECSWGKREGLKDLISDTVSQKREESFKACHQTARVR